MRLPENLPDSATKTDESSTCDTQHTVSSEKSVPLTDMAIHHSTSPKTTLSTTHVPTAITTTTTNLPSTRQSSVWKQGWAEAMAKPPKTLIIICLLIFMVSAFFPTDLAKYDKKHTRTGEVSALVNGTEHYGRFINTALQVGLPIIFKDRVGMVQMVYVSISTTVATQGLKRVFNDVKVDGTRLGQRPNGNPNSKHNMPSGHSSMASCGAYFVCRRYGWRWGLIVIPIMLLTMYTRVMLDAHTISAVIAGAVLGVVATAFFTSPWVERATMAVKQKLPKIEYK